MTSVPVALITIRGDVALFVVVLVLLNVLRAVVAAVAPADTVHREREREPRVRGAPRPANCTSDPVYRR